MKLKNCCISLVLLALTSLAAAQTCPGGLTATNNWCGSYTAVDANCRSGPGGSSQGTCTGMSGGYNIGWYANTNASMQPTSLSASYINDRGAGTASAEVVPNTSVGTSEYMQFANHYVQAFTRSSGNQPIFVNSPSDGRFWPQLASGPWGTSPNQYCGNENNDYTMSYDHVSGLWVLVGMAKVIDPTNGNITKGVLCIAVSTTDELLQANSSNPHCFFTGGYCNFWSTYGFDITGLLPSITGTDGTPFYDLPDYARFGTFVDGNYYVDFDLLDAETGSDGTNGNNNGIIHGFAACQISGSTLRAGNEYNGGTTPPVTCYDRLNASWNTGGFAQIHTLLPADAQTSAAPPATNGEYFLATVSPFVSGLPCVPSATQPCASDRLAYWTWSGITSESLPNYITTNASFVPGCYYTNPTGGGRPFGRTQCIQQPGTTNHVDSVGDRLMSPLAYGYVTDCDEGSTFAASCEYLATTQTIQEDQAWSGGDYVNRATGIRYYTIIAGTSTVAPRILYEGDFNDTSGSGNIYYWMSSNAIDKDQNVGYTFNIDNVSSSPEKPSVYANTINASGTPGTLELVQSGSGSITDSANQSWGEFVSMNVDPKDDLTFWGTGEYLTANETACDSSSTSNCTWSTAIFTCQKGSGLCP